MVTAPDVTPAHFRAYSLVPGPGVTANALAIGLMWKQDARMQTNGVLRPELNMLCQPLQCAFMSDVGNLFATG